MINAHCNVHRFLGGLFVLGAAALTSESALEAQNLGSSRPVIPVATFRGPSQAQCDFSRVQGVVWWGRERQMTLTRFAEYAAPVYWFSPDEPVMDGQRGKDIRIPAALPFQDQPDSPVVYYQYNNIGDRADIDAPAFVPDSSDWGNSIIDLTATISVELKYLAYFPREEGIGGHEHDVEPAAYRMWVLPGNWEKWPEFGVTCNDENLFIMGVQRVTGEAHGLEWFFNVLEVDEYTIFPMTLMVEEGKHAMCTDKNSDGYYTPGFDVNRRVNDAWGIRDIIRGGLLFTGSFESWMAKVRRPEHRVLPPLPEDSPIRTEYIEGGIYGPNNAIYELRPFPAATEAGDNELLHEKMSEKEKVGWPEISEITSISQVSRWLDAGLVLKSFAISVRADGDLGLSFVFPFFIVKNLEDPMTGGFLVHRMYLKDKGLRDFGWMIMYTPSASRWVDTYFAAGAEHDVEDVVPPPADPNASLTTGEWDFVMETGLKFRVNITKSPLKFLSFLTDFMGLRAGIKNRGFFDIKKLTYVLEFGAGVW